MRISIMKACCSLVFLMLPCSLRAQATAIQESPSSSRKFVEEFYGWYVPQALRHHATAAWNVAVRYRGSAFSPELARLLREDSAAQAKCEELIGLDFDPFLNSQDPAKRYEVGEIHHEGRRYRVDIYSVQSGRRSEKANVSAELSKANGHWFFVNFYYPDDTDLLTILKSPRPVCSVPRPVRQE